MRSTPHSVAKLRERLGGFRGLIVAVAVLSGLVNILALTGSFYMLQVYDRVLTSHSVPTLVVLSVLAIVLFSFQGVLDIVRAQILVRIAARIERRLIAPTYDAVLRLPLVGRTTAEAMAPLRDLEAMRGFVAGPGIIALLDMPWLPVYLVFVFMLHLWLGLLTVAGAVVLVCLTLLSERLVKSLSKDSATAAVERHSLAEAHARNAEVLKAHGLRGRALKRFAVVNARYQTPAQSISDRAGFLSGLSKVLRALLQSAILGLGAYLVLKGELTAGAIIAASIAASRALAPIEQAIGSWRVFVGARQAYARLQQTLAGVPRFEEPLELPAPTKSLKVENIVVAAPGTQQVIVNNVSLALEAGQALAIIGPSAAGKSTLARALAGVWPIARGTVRLDGAALDRWSDEARGTHVGYLPQDVELLAGTITETIARMEDNPDPAEVIAAAKAANVHDMILRLPHGYETQIGDRGTALSAGQRQRLGLARALFRQPFLLVLDEPNSNLDTEGEAALAEAINGVRARGGIVIIIAHRPTVLAAVDQVAVMTGGQIIDIGPRDAILQKLARHTTSQPTAANNSPARGPTQTAPHLQLASPTPNAPTNGGASPRAITDG